MLVKIQIHWELMHFLYACGITVSEISLSSSWTSIHFLQTPEKLNHHLSSVSSRQHDKSSLSFLLLVPLLCLSLIPHPEDFLHVLVHHVGDADSRNDLEEVGGDAAIQARYTFMGYDIFELANHCQLGFTLSDG